MNLMLSIEPQLANVPISYADSSLMIGSCFSDHIGAQLEKGKFKVMYNPTGIVFDPLSVASHINDWVQLKQYTKADLHQVNELWFHWQFHSRFSSPEPEITLQQINQSILVVGQFIKTASYLFITLGTAFSYALKSTGGAVANCHKAPADWFNKQLLETDQMVNALKQAVEAVKKINPRIQIVFTVSPVKHIRDGIVENSRSKARLIEVAHHLSETVAECSYFPSYEIVTDVLRDYRFYASDMVHPNEVAIEYVFSFFKHTYFNTNTQQLLKEVKQVVTAVNHKPLHQNTEAYRLFLNQMQERIKTIQQKLPHLNWEEELGYFGNTSS